MVIIQIAKFRLKIDEWYVDKGISGSLRDRHGLNRLLADIETDGISEVFTYSLDRLARNLALSMIIEKEFKKHNVKLYTVMEKFFDLGDPSQKFIKHTRERIAELEADLARLRTEAALRKNLIGVNIPKGLHL
ncbi:recombinase family protein [Candidatus Aerophobetes bacterium]|nr:recombinase family protein [Candidatus Aerophobetes bacterium]